MWNKLDGALTDGVVGYSVRAEDEMSSLCFELEVFSSAAVAVVWTRKL